MSSGRLVPDDVVNRLVADALAESEYRNVLFDGFPRTLEQARWLIDELERNGAGIDAVISLRVPEDDIVKRLSGRRTDRETGTIYHVEFNPPPADLPDDRLVHRDDDRPEAIRRRLEVYGQETAPLEAFFRERERLVEVDGLGEVDEVAGRVAEALDAVESDRVA
jgi:adenylate kinase